MNCNSSTTYTCLARNVCDESIAEVVTQEHESRRIEYTRGRMFRLEERQSPYRIHARSSVQT